MDYEIWTNKAIMKIGELACGLSFVIKDLFPGIEWNKLATGEKYHLGRKFKKAVENGIIPNIMIIESPKGTSNTYKKTK